MPSTRPSTLPSKPSIPRRLPGCGGAMCCLARCPPAARQIGQIGQIDFAGPHWLANIPCGCITGPRQVNP